MALTSEALEKLLVRFSSDREEAGSQYELARSKLICFFERRKAETADTLADEALDRVARRLDEGVQIENLPSYILAVARHVLQEYQKRKPTVSIEDVHDLRAQIEVAAEAEPRLECLDSCMASLAHESRQLIMGYYQEERRAKIELRQRLAEKLGIELNALRIRAHRIRSTLEKCITKCVETVQGRNESSVDSL